MTDQIVAVTPGAGVNVQTYENTVNGNVVEAQAMVNVDLLGVPIGTAANPLVVREGKDGGRTRVAIVFQAVAPATADTLLSLVKVSAGVAAAASTSIGVTAGKTLRINAIGFSLKAGAAAAAFATMTLRSNPTGATVIGSQSEVRLDVGSTAATIGSSVFLNFTIPDGIEFSGAQTLGVSLSAQAVTNVVSISLLGFEYS